MSLSVRARSTAWYAALLTIVLVVLGSFLVLQLDDDLRQDLDQELRTSSTALARDLADDPQEAEPEDVDPQEDVRGFGEVAQELLPPRSAAQLVDAGGRVRASYGPVSGTRPLLPVTRPSTGGQVDIMTARLGAAGQPYRVGVTALTLDAEASVLVVAASLRSVEDTVHRVVVLLLVAGPAALLATAVVAYWLTSLALQPVRRMTSDAQRIGDDGLHERVAVPAATDEMGRLAWTLNAMLDRIERGVVQRRRLVADASHELRTPLAVMRAELEVSLRGGNLPAEAREVMHSAVDEVDRMSRTVDNLLLVAELEEGNLELLTAPVELHRAARDAVRPLQSLAVAKGVTLVLGGVECTARVDPHRFRLALTNLIENAIKFTPSGGAVRVESWERGPEVGLTVSDDGPGIPEQERARLFERFYRTPDSREQQSEGSGLGLAISHSVALAHGGRLDVASELGRGSAFTLAVPAGEQVPGDPDDLQRREREPPDRHTA